jgi:hypothetical protein
MIHLRELRRSGRGRGDRKATEATPDERMSPCGVANPVPGAAQLGEMIHLREK